MNFEISTIIYLSLESFHNAGLKPEETRKVIENIPDPGCSKYLSCREGGINNNWNVITAASSRSNINYIVARIANDLCFELEKRNLPIPFGYFKSDFGDYLCYLPLK